MEDIGAEAERKGLGTLATRADVIEKLARDGFVRREKKWMVPGGVWGMSKLRWSGGKRKIWRVLCK